MTTAAAAAIAAGLSGGCQLHGDPHYNPYAPHNDAPSFFDHAEGINGWLEGSLDNLDARMENAVY